MPDWTPLPRSPVQKDLKFSHVRGSAAEKSSNSTRPTSFFVPSLPAASNSMKTRTFLGFPATRASGSSRMDMDSRCCMNFIALYTRKRKARKTPQMASGCQPVSAEEAETGWATSARDRWIDIVGFVTFEGLRQMMGAPRGYARSTRSSVKCVTKCTGTSIMAL